MTSTLQPFGLSVGIETAIGADLLLKGRTMSASSRTERIRELNDAFRTTLEGGRCLFTAGVSDYGIPFSTAALAPVKGTARNSEWLKTFQTANLSHATCKRLWSWAVRRWPLWRGVSPD